jgi:hypothetical protein
MQCSRVLWSLCLFLLGLCLFCAGNASAFGVPVSVTNATDRGGRVFLTVESQFGQNAGLGKSATIAASGSASVTVHGFQADGSYRVRAFLDTQGYGAQHANDPAGEADFTVSGGVVTVVNSAPGGTVSLTLANPPPVAATTPKYVNIQPGAGAGLITWDTPRGGDRFYQLADSYNVYWSTDPNPGPNDTAGGGMRLGVPGSSLLISGLDNGTTLYAAVIPVQNGVEQSGAAAVTQSPVTIGPDPFGGSPVTVTVNSAGIAKNGPNPTPLVVAAMMDQGPGRFTVVKTPGDSETVTLALPSGTYKIYALLDLTGNGYLSGYPGVIGGSDALAPVVTVDGGTPVTVDAPIDLAARLSLNADVRLTLDHGRAHGVPNSDSYQVGVQVRDQAKHVVNVSYDPQGADLGRDGFDSYSLSYRTPLPARPNVGDSFGITVRYSDGSSEQLAPQVTAVPDSFPSPVAPLGTISGGSPTFSWSAPAPAPAQYSYQLSLSNGWSPRQKIGSDQLSFPYDPSQAVLSPGDYSWSIGVTDLLGNSAHETAGFTVGAGSITFSGFVTNPAGVPLANVTVRLQDNPGLSTVSAADGSFTISGLPAGVDCTLKASGDGIADSYFGPYNSSSNISGWILRVFSVSELANWGSDGLVPGTGVITGQVIAPGAGMSLAGATVSIVSSTGSYSVLYDDGSGNTPVAGTATGNNGRFYIFNVTDGDTVTITAYKTGWTFKQKVLVGHANQVSSGNLPALTIAFSGKVVDSAQNPVPGASVQLFGYPGIGTVSGADGRFTVKGLPAGNDFPLVFTKDGYAPIYSTAINSAQDLTSSIPFVMFTPDEIGSAGTGMVTGVVVDQSGISQGGAVVTANSSLHPQTPYAVSYFDGANYGGGATYGNGIFVIRGVTRGDIVTVNANKPGWIGGALVSNLTNADAATEGVIALFPAGAPPTVSYSGAVADSANNPVAGALVQMVGNPSLNATTGSDGSFTLNGLPSGTPFSLTMSKDGYLPVYSGDIVTNFDMVAASPFALFTPAQVAGFGVTPGKGVIRTKVVDLANQASGFLAGVTVTATSVLHPDTPYAVTYFDGTNYGGNSTYQNGLILVANIADGDTVTLNANKPGYNPGMRTYQVHADAVSEGRIPLQGAFSLNASPAYVDFGTVTVGNVSGVTEISFANNGSTSMSIYQDGTGVYGTDAGMFQVSSNGTRNPCPQQFPITLSPGQSCTVGVSFAPTDAGIRKAALDVNTGSQTLQVPLSGTAVAAAPQVYLTGFFPDNGTVGAQVIIRGGNFDPTAANNSVSFNGTPATAVLVGGDGALVATVPQGATTGPVSVSNSLGSAASGYPFTVTTSITFGGGATDSAGHPVPGATVSMTGNPALSATADASGMFVLAGLPVNTTFSLQISGTGFAPSYTSNLLPTFNPTSSSYVLYTPAEIASWGVTDGKGVIRSRVADVYNASSGYLGGAVVTASSTLHPSTPYTVTYYDGTGYGGSVTYSNGIYLVLNVDDGDTVTVTATKSGWYQGSKKFRTHAGGVSQGKVLLSGPTFRYGGQALDTGNAPVAGAMVQASSYSATFTATGSDGSFSLSGLPTTGSFNLRLSKVGFLPIYSAETKAGNLPPASFTFFTAGETASIGVTPGKGVIISRVVDASTPDGGLSGVVVMAESTLHPQTPYQVSYFDGTAPGGPATYGNGVFLVLNVDEGDLVSLVALKGGYNTASRSYTVHADAVSEGDISLAKTILAANPGSLDFGSVTVGSSSETGIVTLTNVTGGDLAVSSASIFGTDAALFQLAPAGPNPCPQPPATFAAGGSCSVGITFTPASSGTKKAVFSVFTGNSSAPVLSVPISGTVMHPVTDAKAPSVDQFSLQSPSNSLNVQVASFAASDDIGVVGYLITASATSAPSAAAPGWSPQPPSGFSFPAATTGGVKTLYAWAKDASGKVSPYRSATVTIDLSPPVVGIFTAKSPVNSLSVPITAFSATDNIAVTGYLITDNGTAPDPTSSDWSSSAPQSFSFKEPGAKILYAWAKDAAGNVSAAKTATTVIDTTAPVVSLKAPAQVKSLTIPVTVSASDDRGVTGYLITLTDAAPAATLATWTALPPVSYGVATAGVKTLYAWAKDALGNVSAPSSATVNVDTAPPAVSSFALASPVATLTVPVTSFVASDNTAVTGYLITAGSTAPGAASAGWSDSAPSSFTFSSGGLKTAYAWVKDGAGNVSAAKSATVNIDNTAPLVGTFTVKTPVNSTSVTITALSATDATGVTGYLVSESPVAPAADNGDWKATAPTSYTVADTGDRTLYAWAKDALGNVSAARTAVVTVDMEAPQISSFSAPGLVKTLTIPVSLSATDNKGVTGYGITTNGNLPTVWSATVPTSFTSGSNGVQTLYAWAKDAAGNISKATTATVNFDNVPPVVTTFTLASPVNTLTVPVTAFVATDATGVTGYLITSSTTAPLATATGWSATAPTSVAFGFSGIKTVYAWAKDAIGNVSLMKSATAIIDTAAPLVTSFVVKSEVNSLDIPVTLTASDNIKVTGFMVTESPSVPAADSADWKNAAPTVYSVDSAGPHTLYAWAKDGAGNVSLARSVSTFVDLDAPQVTAFSTVAATNSLTVPITAFSATDTRGVTGYLITTGPTPTGTWSTKPPTSFNSSVSGSVILYAWAKDPAGNISAPVTSNVNIDVTAPVISSFILASPAKTPTVPITQLIASDANGVTGYLVTTTATAPLASAAGWTDTPPTSYSFAAAGSYLLYAWAKDAMGNVSAGKSAVVVVDMTAPVVGTFTAKSVWNSLTVPVVVTATDNINVAGYLISESQTTPDPALGNWTPAAPTSYTASTTGSVTLYAWAKDAAGNVSAAKSVKTVIDTQAPQVLAFQVPEQVNKLAIPVTSFTGTDDTAITGYLITISSGTPALTAAWSAAAPASFTVATAGTKTLYAWVRDAAGNISHSATATVNVDIARPAVSAFSFGPVTSLTVPVASFSAGDNTAVTGYLITATSIAPLATADGWSNTPPSSYTFASTGTKIAYAWAKDGAGNVSAYRAASVTIPTTTLAP